MIKTASDRIAVLAEHRFCCPRIFVCSQSVNMRKVWPSRMIPSFYTEQESKCPRITLVEMER